jgi:anti-sigma-K factor RskA
MNTPRDPSDNNAGNAPPGDEVRAAEYVVGVLDSEERREVEARIARDDVFARRVGDWERYFAPWLASVPPAEPPAHVWLRIRSQLGWGATPPQRTLWNNTAFWRGMAGLATAAGIAAIAVMATRLQPPPQPTASEEQAARPVTVLARDNGATGWIARIDPTRSKVLMVPVPTAADATGQAHELWIIPADGTPRSLGFLSNDKAHTIDVPPTLQAFVAAGATLAVTLEEQAGIPHRAPNGPVVAKGSIQSI